MSYRLVMARLGTTVLVALGLGALVAVPARADEAEPLYEPGSVATIELQMPQGSMEALETEPPSDEYQPGTFSLALEGGTPDGVGQLSAPIVVGIRLKGGHGSFRRLADQKAGFKVKFNFVKGQKFLGLKKLTLNNMVQDPSMVHETLTYEAFRAVGLPAPRTGYAYVRLNGVDYGVYLNLETYDDVSLPHWFGSTRHLYEADAPGTDLTPGGAGDFEVDEGDDEDLSDLEALIAAANAKAGDWSEGMEPVADLPQMARMWAVERYVGHWDGYAGAAGPFRPNNYYLHSGDSGAGAGRFSMLPWGSDRTWETQVEFDEPAGGLLFDECMDDGDCLALYVEALEGLRQPLGALELGRQVDCLAELLAPWQALEDADRREYEAGEIAEGVAATQGFVAERPAELAEWLGAPPPPPAVAGPCRPAPPGNPGTGPVGMPPSETSLPPTPTVDRRQRLRLGRIRIDDGQLKARLELPRPGRLKLEAWIGNDVSGRRACEPFDRFRRAGAASVSRPLGAAARRRLGDGPFALTVRATLATRDRDVGPAVRTVELPRR